MDRSEIDSLKAELRRMQSRVDELETADDETPTGRRNMLRGLGAAAAGAAVGSLAFARPAAAVDVVIGSNNTTGDATAIITSGAYAPTRNIGLLHLTDDISSTNAQTVTTALTIAATGVDLTVGAKISGSTTGAKLSGPVPLKLNSSSAPSQGTGTQGQFIHSSGDLWFCVSSAGSLRWRKISTGQFTPITPVRVYDSRAAAPTPGVLAPGANRLVSVASGRDSNGTINAANVVPAGATAVAANVTVVGTAGNFGFLCINPGGNTAQNTSVINWTAPNQVIANGLILTLNASREITVVNGTGGGNTGFFVDVSGYYL